MFPKERFSHVIEAERTNSQVEGLIRGRHPKQKPSVSALHLCLSTPHTSTCVPPPSPPAPAAGSDSVCRLC